MNALVKEVIMESNNKRVHLPVMLDEVMEYLALKEGDVVLDCTMGMGGHSERILEAILPGGKLIGIDRDEKSIQEAQRNFSRFKDGFYLFQDNFVNLKKILSSLSITKVDAILFDLGMSSYQLGSGRGFSFQEDCFLDMRMDEREKLTAYDIVNYYSEKELSKIIRDFGEERYHFRIAHAIANQRREKVIETTKELVEVILRAIPYSYLRQRIHPATRTFQALRIAVNRELENLKTVLGDAIDVLLPNGKIAVISFHSLEDRIVKRTFRDYKQTGHFEILTPKPVGPAELEVKVNPKARSGKLRVGKKLKNGHTNLLLKIFML
ncbi:MAG: 16S rRNA (cytosine(1402)-N(4))-methyltransferase RsmH [Candidatus Saelkia tenebricola]|nr:16S rRNA (cytosine(1402)-N(4))-methyltransferase RsmH [Candidatus Saelkia tenebricola]